MPLAHDPFSSIIRVSWNALNHFVAGDASSDLYTSPDGIAWTALGRMGYGASGTGSAARSAYANQEGIWYFGRSGVSPLASYSADGGQTWALSRDNPYAPTAGTLSFVYDIDAQQMYADQYRIDNSELYLLENFHVSGGTSYAPAPAWLQKKIRTGIATAPFVRMVAPSREFDLENGNYFLYSPYLEISVDNETWVTVDPGLAEFPGTGPFDIAAGKGVLVAVGHKGIAATADGVTWSLVHSIPPSPVEPGEGVSPSEYVEWGVRSVAFAGRFVATPEWGGSPRVYLSLDGIAWSTVATGMSSSFDNVSSGRRAA